MSTSVASQATGSETSSDLVWYWTVLGPGRASGAVSTGSPWGIPFGPHRLIFEEPIPEYARSTLMEIGWLGELEEDWDSYGARPIEPRCALTAAQLILGLLGSDDPEPAVVPTTAGGIQFEWHRRGASLEIEVAALARVNVFFEDHALDDHQEFVLTGDPAPLVSLLERLGQ